MCTFWVIFILKYFIFIDAILNDIKNFLFLISYRNRTDLCIFILYLDTLQN